MAKENEVKKEHKSEWFNLGPYDVDVKEINGPDKKGQLWGVLVLRVLGRWTTKRVVVPPSTKTGVQKLPLMVGISGMFIPKE